MEIIQIPLSVTNCYLIKTNHQYILIDTGYEYDWELFRQRLTVANVSLSQVSHIILTHHHDDHCGLLHKILAENSDIRVIMSHLSPELLLKGENDQTHGGGLLNRRIRWLIILKRYYLSIILKKRVVKENNLKFPPYRIRANDILVKGETKLQGIGIDLKGRIIETPGHTIDSIAVLLDDGDCITGDAAANFLRFAGTKYCVIFITNLDEYYQSWRKIIAGKARRIFPAHGKSFTVEKLKKYIGRNKKENQVTNQS
jgi:glyoxylase-like metal-dependent hydrolase (beta-lactamase superfamily II)